jgi:hypothetical protein
MELYNILPFNNDLCKIIKRYLIISVDMCKQNKCTCLRELLINTTNINLSISCFVYYNGFLIRKYKSEWLLLPKLEEQM